MDWIITFLVIFTTFKYSYQLATLQGDPIVVNVNEDETMLRTLHTFVCTSDRARDVPVVSLNTVSPINTVCSNCFQIRRETMNSDFQLYYLPSRGPLNRAAAQIYMLEVQCEDSDPAAVVTTLTVEVRVVPNHPPAFNQPIDNGCSVNGIFTAAGTLIRQAVVTDDDNDDLNFTMTVVPAMTNVGFYIDNEGNIRNRHPLERVCVTSISFRVYVTDHKQPGTVGPAAITCDVLNPYYAPSIGNIDRTISIEENVTLPYTLVTMATTPTTPLVQYDISTVPSDALWLFEVDNNDLRLIHPPSFEDANHQNINVSVIPFNDYCRSEGHYLFIRVTNVNDIPKLVPDLAFMAVNEGTINTPFSIILVDQDFGDSHTYEIIGGDPNNLFDINQANRHIVSVGTYDVDQGTDPENATLIIEVTDAEGAKANATVRIRFDDINDNAPVIDQTTLTFTQIGCSYVNSVMGQVTATDLDSARNGNNRISYTGVCDGPLCVASDGSITVTGLMAESASYSVDVFATDHGTDPGPLTSSVPATVALTTSVCPTTTIITTVAPTTVSVASTSNNSSASASASSSSSSSSSSSGTSSTGTTSSGTLDGGTIAAIVLGVLAVPLLILGGLFLMSKMCPGALGSLKTSCCGPSGPSGPKPNNRIQEPRLGRKQTDYWRPPSDTRPQRRVSPQQPQTPGHAERENQKFDYWGNGNQGGHGKPQAARDLGMSSYL